MVYMGSKRRIAQDLAKLIKVEPGQTYYEPFVGGANMIEHVNADVKVGSDNNGWLIALWCALQNGWEPPEFISKEQYAVIRKDKSSCSPYLVGYVGIICSFRGKFFGGYSGIYKNRNYQAERLRNVKEQLKHLTDVQFVWSDYRDLLIAPNSVIYCDPPYAATTSYHSDFNHEEFFDWCRMKSAKGHKVFVSEYQAPNDFTCIYEQPLNCALGTSKAISAVEKLFTLE